MVASGAEWVKVVRWSKCEEEEEEEGDEEESGEGQYVEVEEFELEPEPGEPEPRLGGTRVCVGRMFGVIALMHAHACMLSNGVLLGRH
jgi:hypothetical protein